MASKHRDFVAAHRDRYDELLALQDGHCALCPAAGVTRRLNIDHDHRTMTLRGLLCHRCNRGLPPWVTVEWLERAVGYLTAPPASALKSLDDTTVEGAPSTT